MEQTSRNFKRLETDVKRLQTMNTDLARESLVLKRRLDVQEDDLDFEVLSRDVEVVGLKRKIAEVEDRLPPVIDLSQEDSSSDEEGFVPIVRARAVRPCVRVPGTD